MGWRAPENAGALDGSEIGDSSAVGNLAGPSSGMRLLRLGRCPQPRSV
jgi:hypothetical protein